MRCCCFVGEELEARSVSRHFFFFSRGYLHCITHFNRELDTHAAFFVVVLDDWVASVGSSVFWARENWV